MTQTGPDEALLCLVRNEFAALLLDIKMPGMSGIELAALIKPRKRSEPTGVSQRSICGGPASGTLRFLPSITRIGDGRSIGYRRGLAALLNPAAHA